VRPGVSQPTLFDHVTQALLRLSQRFPLVLVLDDLQWMNRGSANMLFHLARRLEGSRALVCGAYRRCEIAPLTSGGAHPLQAVVAELAALCGENGVDLDQAGGRRFVDALLDAEPNHFESNFRDALCRLTEGHPLFTVDLLDDLRERGVVAKDSRGAWAVRRAVDWERLPPRVEGIVAARLQRMTPRDRLLLSAASVQGEVFVGEIAADVAGMVESEAVHRLSGPLRDRYQMVRAHSLERPGHHPLSCYRFRHAVYQRFLLDCLDPILRARFHEGIAQQLESRCMDRWVGDTCCDASPARLAAHYEAAGCCENAASAYLRAGTEAFRLSANEDAVNAFEQGLRVLNDAPVSRQRDELEFALQMAMSAPLRAARGYGDTAVGRACARACDVAERLGSSDRAFLANGSLGNHFFFRAEYGRALRITTELIAAARARGDRQQEMQARQGHGATLLMLGDLRTALDCLEPEPGSAGPGGTDLSISPLGQNLQVIGFALAAWALWSRGFPDTALARSRASLDLAVRLDHPYALAFARGVGTCVVHMLRRECRDVLEEAQALHACARRHGFKAWEGWADTFIGCAHVEHGQLDEGMIALRRGLATYRDTGQCWSLTMLLAMLAHAYLVASRLEEAECALVEAQEMLRKTGERFYEAELHRLRGDLLAVTAEREGDAAARRALLQQAATCYTRACRVARRQGARSLELRAVLSSVQLADQHRDDSEGDIIRRRAALRDIVGAFDEGFDSPELSQARLLLHDDAPTHAA
jgi:tetratricopeptide (TPR) repeat protein